MKTFRFAVIVIAAALLIYIINFTSTMSPRYDYVKLRSGKEFRNVKVRWDHNSVIIDSQKYGIEQLDSISESPIKKRLPDNLKWMSAR